MSAVSEQLVLEALKKVQDPELHRDIVSLVRRIDTSLGELLNVCACILLPG